MNALWDNTLVKAGRQEIDTPFADTDDIGMIPNTFEAVILKNSSMEDTTIMLGDIHRWAGVDSPVPEHFTRINGNKGMQFAGVVYEGINDTSMMGYFYYLKGLAKLSYMEMNWKKEEYDYTYSAAAQFAYQDYFNGGISRIWGGLFSFGIKKYGLNTTLSYNKTIGLAAENFFGGGPYFSNAEHLTLKEAGRDGKALLWTLQWNAASMGIEGLEFAWNIHRHMGKKKAGNEYDFIISYAYNDHLEWNAVYSNVNDSPEKFTNFRTFINYRF